MKKTREFYLEKLKDPRWQRLRLKVFERDNWCCQHCGSNKHTLVVHHRYYLKSHEPWDYPLAALITLCQGCHENETAELPMFAEKRREEDIFYVAQLLTRGGANEYEISQVTHKLAEACGFPPDEAVRKVISALNRVAKAKKERSELQASVKELVNSAELLNLKEHNLHSAVREIIDIATGNFNLLDIFTILDIKERKEKNNVYQVVHKLCKEGVIEKHGTRNGHYRKINNVFG